MVGDFLGKSKQKIQNKKQRGYCRWYGYQSGNGPIYPKWIWWYKETSKFWIIKKFSFFISKMDLSIHLIRTGLLFTIIHITISPSQQAEISLIEKHACQVFYFNEYRNALASYPKVRLDVNRFFINVRRFNNLKVH